MRDELEAAFADEDETNEESRLMETTESDSDSARAHTHAGSGVPQIHIPPRLPCQMPANPGTASTPTYDFEREYDYDVPPPGSPSALAQPNEWGNSNGVLPPPVTSIPSINGPSFVSRMTGWLPWGRSQYTAVPTAGGSGPAMGSGILNDGVFANLPAKPTLHPVVQPDGNVHYVPEDSTSLKDVPPTYADAQLDQAPSYDRAVATVHVSASDYDAERGAGGESVGKVITFCMHFIISFLFQFIGFGMTYMMANDLAGRAGSRAGLGATLVQVGVWLRRDVDSAEEASADAALAGRDDGTLSGVPPTEWTADGANADLFELSPPFREWLSFFCMTLGWFMILHSVGSFWRARRWEKAVNSPTPSVTVTRDDYERDLAVRRNLENVFGVGLDGESQLQRHHETIVDANGHVVVIPDRVAFEEARLARDLRAAGLL